MGMLTEETKEKLDTIVALQARRDAIDAELNELLGGSSSEVSPAVKTTRKYTKRKGGVTKLQKVKGKNSCGNCGQGGHTRPTCSEVLAKIEVEEDAEAEEESTVALTEHQFDEIKTCKDHGLSSRAVARDMKTSLIEVNLAWPALSYGDYLDDRAG